MTEFYVEFDEYPFCIAVQARSEPHARLRAILWLLATPLRKAAVHAMHISKATRPLEPCEYARAEDFAELEEVLLPLAKQCDQEDQIND